MLDHLSVSGIVLHLVKQLWPLWIALAATMAPSYLLRRNLGLYGELYKTGTGVAGIAIVCFWVYVALLAPYLSPFDPLEQIPAMRNALPGAIDVHSQQIYLLGGDTLARDVFTRVIYGSQVVLFIAPLATFIALAVGITLGLPAGYLGGLPDATLSFVANLIMAFPVILLFYLLVSPEMAETPAPQIAGGGLFAFPVVLSVIAFWSRYSKRPVLLALQLLFVALIPYWLVSAFIFYRDPLDLVRVTPSTLNIFIAVVFASTPGVFRIVRGLVIDMKTRDYVAAAQTRGESPWYIAIWEILPNARGPLIVDSCIRIGYTTTLLGTLGFFGLGMPSESPDWGTTIQDGSQLLRAFSHPVLPPAIALMSLVLGLNLLADALHEQSMKD